MESRMEKYYTSDVSNISRSKKNQNLYNDIYRNNDIDNYNVSDNTSEIDLSKLKRVIESRDDYKKIKEYEKISNKKIMLEKQKEEVINKEEKVYDINELLKRAKTTTSRSNNNSNSNMYNYNFLASLKDSDLVYNEDDNDVYEEKEISKTSYTTERISNNPRVDKIVSTTSLPLDILSDLKPTDDTIVSAPIIEEEKTIIQEKSKKKDNDATFYSGSYTFSKKDFVDDALMQDKKDHYGLKIVLLLLGIVICIIVIYFMLNSNNLTF